MGVYIKGVEMPTERESFNLTIKYNGTVLDTETGMQVAEAYELPPHGRLIDADALRAFAYERQKETGIACCVDALDISLAPTIIPASEGETE